MFFDLAFSSFFYIIGSVDPKYFFSLSVKEIKRRKVKYSSSQIDKSQNFPNSGATPRYAKRYPLGRRQAQGNAPLHELLTYPDRGVSH